MHVDSTTQNREPYSPQYYLPAPHHHRRHHHEISFITEWIYLSLTLSYEMFWGLVKNLSNNFSFSNNNHKSGTGSYSGGGGGSNGGGGGRDGRKRIAYNLLNMTDDEEDEDSDSGLQLSTSPNHLPHTPSSDNYVQSSTSNKSGGGMTGKNFSTTTPDNSPNSLSSIILKSQNKSNSVNTSGVSKGKSVQAEAAKPGNKPNTNTTLTALKFTFEDFSDDSDYGDEDDDDEDEDEEDEDEEDDGVDDVDEDGDAEADEEDYENHDIRASPHVSSSTGDDESSSDFEVRLDRNEIKGVMKSTIIRDIRTDKTATEV